MQATGNVANNIALPVGYDVNGNPITTFLPAGLQESQVSWQAVNDLSARPAATGPNTNLAGSHSQIILNSLGDLSNRENRFAYSRFANDFYDVATGGNFPDGIADDLNSDNAPDFYPTMYYNSATQTLNGGPMANGGGGLLNIPPSPPGAFQNPVYTALNMGLMAFPFKFPGAYSRPQALTLNNGPNNGPDIMAGWIHSPEPYVLFGGNEITFDANPAGYVNTINHNPLDIGDNLPLPPPANPNGNANYQTWWGFPTWRETLSPFWADPTVQVNVALAQPTGLNPISLAEVQQQFLNNDGNGRALLPAMTSLWRPFNPQLFCDGWGDAAGNGNNTFFPSPAPPTVVPLWSNLSWEDDLIMTGVRSFDVKAYENSLASYMDLGWGDDPRYNGNAGAPLLLLTTPAALTTFGHEGRMPPLTTDNRLDAQYGLPTYLPSTSPFLPANGGTYTGNIGDNAPYIDRLRRVWDSWSTEYTQAPANGVYFNPNNNLNNNPMPAPNGDPLNGFPWGPNGGTPPIYPSYPPPYPLPLRGIQIQVRVVDPSNQRVKSLTIRQDFTDKL